jgi:CheY-like chemotaxis protein
VLSSPDAVPLEGLRIMIVDDHVDAADSLGLLLELRGATVAVLHDGPSGLARLDDFMPDAIMLDLGMPEMDGFEVARQIRLRPEFREVVLIAQTGWGTQEMREQSQQAGFHHHLVKPGNFEALIALLARIRDRRATDAAS